MKIYGSVATEAQNVHQTGRAIEAILLSLVERVCFLCLKLHND